MVNDATFPQNHNVRTMSEAQHHTRLLTLNLVSTVTIQRTAGLLYFVQQLLALLLQLAGKTEVHCEKFTQVLLHSLQRTHTED